MSLPVPFWAFMAIRFAEGCAHITALSLLLSLASDRAPAGRRGRTMGVMGGGLSLGVALGAPLGGVLGRQDALLPLQVGAGILLGAAALAAWRLRDARVASSRPTLRQAASAVAADRGLAVPLAFAFVDRFTVGFLVTTFPLYTRRVLDLSPADTGYLLALFLLPFSLLSYVFGRLSERLSRSLLVAGGSACYGIGLATLGWWSGDGLPYLMLALGVLSAVMFVPSLVMATDLASPETRSTYVGAFNAAGSLGFILGPAVGGTVSQTVAAGYGWQAGYTAAFAVAGLSEMVCVAVALSRMRRLVREGRTT
jgi:predicted MFS family arabinose efflux permease